MFYNLRELIYNKLKFATYTRNITKWNSIIASKGRIFKKNHNYKPKVRGQPLYLTTSLINNILQGFKCLSTSKHLLDTEKMDEISLTILLIPFKPLAHMKL